MSGRSRWCPARSRRGGRERSTSGYALVEAAVALTLAGVALAVTLALLAQEPAARLRLAARAEALAAAEASLEAVRARALPLAAGPVPPAVWAAGEPGGAAEELAVVLLVDRLRDVDPAAADAPAALFRVTAQAAWRVRGRPHAESLATVVWAP